MRLPSPVSRHPCQRIRVGNGAVAHKHFTAVQVTEIRCRISIVKTVTFAQQRVPQMQADNCILGVCLKHQLTLPMLFVDSLAFLV